MKLVLKPWKCGLHHIYCAFFSQCDDEKTHILDNISNSFPSLNIIVNYYTSFFRADFELFTIEPVSGMCLIRVFDNIDYKLETNIEQPINYH